MNEQQPRPYEADFPSRGHPQELLPAGAKKARDKCVPHAARNPSAGRPMEQWHEEGSGFGFKWGAVSQPDGLYPWPTR